MRFRCETCQIDEAMSDRSLSYSTWLTTPHAFAHAPRVQRDVPENQRLSALFLAHRGHAYRVYDEDLGLEEAHDQRERWR